MEALSLRNVSSCADPTCGYGQLLLSAEAQWPKAHFLGLDIDRRAVERVRRYRPHWAVSVGDLMSPKSLSRTQIFRTKGVCEVLLTNPPFSMGKAKGVIRRGFSYRCSVAMAHIFAAIEFFQPKLGIGAIVPESLLYSDLDETSRADLARTWTLEKIVCVPQSTFKGTNARSTLIALRPRDIHGAHTLVRPKQTRLNLSADLVRGGLPVHQADFSQRGGLPFIHSTDLSGLADGMYKSRTASPIDRGRTVGTVILLPRVGVPSIKQISPLNFTRPVQLSDCVIGLRFKSNHAATAAANVMRAEFHSLEHLYRGTGARYVSVRRLEKWCGTVGIQLHITRVSIGKDLVVESQSETEHVIRRPRISER